MKMNTEVLGWVVLGVVLAVATTFLLGYMWGFAVVFAELSGWCAGLLIAKRMKKVKS